MTNLTASNFNRLFKSKIFYSGLIFCVGFALFRILIKTFEYISPNPLNELLVLRRDFFLNSDFACFGIISAIFISLFIGRDYSDGTIRNKLSIGHSRLSIYIANFIVCIAAEIIMHIAYLVTFILLTAAVFHDFDEPVRSLLHTQLIGLCVIAAYSAIFLMITMISDSKVRAATASMLTAVILLILGNTAYENVLPQKNLEKIESDLAIGIIQDNFTDMDEAEFAAYDFEPIMEEFRREYREQIEQEREKKLSGIDSIYTILSDMIPSSQIKDSARYYAAIKLTPPRAARYILWDCGIIVITTAVGIIIFSR